MLDRDEYMRKVNQQNASAFNHFVMYQKEMNKKRQKLMKRNACLEMVANSADIYQRKGGASLLQS